MSLLKATKAALKNVGFTDETIRAIEKWPKFVEALDHFVMNHPDKTKPPFIEAPDESTSSVYLFEGTDDEVPKSIYILRKHFGPISENGCLMNLDQHLAVLDLAHELTHAYQDAIYASPVINYAQQPRPEALTSSFFDYISINNKMEGEAIYNEFLALHLIYGDEIEAEAVEYTKYLRDRWKNNETDPTFTPHNDLYGDLTKIVFGPLSHEEKIEKLAEKNSEFIVGYPSLYDGSSEDQGIKFTYDEKYRWDWLKKNTDMAIDYLEARGIQVRRCSHEID